jgi:three-Cys-motif partner protein
MKRLRYDVIGYWSEVKLDIIKEYASAYTKIMAAQKSPRFKYIYIDAFAGAGKHISRETRDMVPGSPLIALNLEEPFQEYHFVDLNNLKVAELEKIAAERNDVFTYTGDCNDILPHKVLPLVDYKRYRRALCILDPYGLHLNWNIIKTAGEMKSVEIFLNFPIMDINMNVLKHDQSKVAPDQVARMNAFWGDDSWRNVGYVQAKQQSLFGDETNEKTSNEELEKGFRKRLKEVAGFKYVPEPMPMRNSNNAVVYYLYFASQRPVAADIIKYIFKKYSNWGNS